MSQKNIGIKIIASFVALSIVLGNCSLFGMGISQVIAESQKAPTIELKLENQKYVQYIDESYSGVAIQSKLSITAEQGQDAYIPTKTVMLEMNMPNINGYLPERANVVKASTEATTGELNNSKINQSYSKESGLLTVSYENVDEEGNILYSEYKENVKDEFEIIYIYPQEAYVGNEKEIKLNYDVKVTATYKNNDSETTTEKKESVEIREKENKGDITTFAVTELKENIYKGFMYSNVQNKTNYDTNYKTVSTMTILNSDIANELVMKSEEDKFVLNDEEETSVLAKENIVYTTTGIKKEEFDRILGQEGMIEFYEGEEVVAQVKYIDVEEENGTVKRLAVIYSDDNIEILSEEDAIAVVKHKEGKTNLTIKTTKPIAEGFLNFENQNTIKASKDYGCKIEEIKYINSKTSINDYEIDTKIALSEPETKISVETSNKNFPTLQKSKTTLTIKLDDTNTSTKLFNNPTIIVKLPEGLKGGNLSSPEILNGNGLKIKSTEAKDNTITIKLEGKQTEYDINNVSGGVNIVMDIENIDFEDTTPTHADKIEVTCTQEKEKTTSSCDINIVSKSGLLILSKTNGYDNKNSITTNMDSSVKEIEITNNDSEKEVVQTLAILNNYDKNLEKAQIIGRIGYSDETTISTFDVALTKEIKLSKTNAKVYYSENKNANYYDDSWTEKFSKDAKLYKIVLNNEILDKKDKIEITINVHIPKNLDYNQSTYLRTEVNYVYNNENRKDVSTIGMLTSKNELSRNVIRTEQTVTTEKGINIPINMSITPKITQNYVHSGQLVTYKIKVENNSEQDLEDIFLKDIIPDNAIYTYKEEKVGTVTNYTEIKEDNSKKEVTWEINTLKAGERKEFEIMLTMASITEEQDIINNIKLEYNEQIIQLSSELRLKPASIKTRLTTSEEEMVNVIYDTNDIIEYRINVSNIVSKTIENIKIEYNIPEYLEYVEGGLGKYDEFEGYSIEEQGTLNNNIFEYNIEKLKENKSVVIILRCKVNRLQEIYEADIESIANIIVGEETYQTNIKNIKTSQATFQISMKSNIDEGNILKKDDTVIYTIKVTNIGERSSMFDVQTDIPSEIEVSKIEYGIEDKEKTTIETSMQKINITNSLEKDEILTIKITGKVKPIKTENGDVLKIVNTAYLLIGEYKIQSNEIQHQIETDKNEEEKDIVDSEIINEESSDNGENQNIDEVGDTESDKKNNNENEAQNKLEDSNNEDNEDDLYNIYGIAWLDSNKNGKRDNDEKLMESIVVTLLNKDTGDIVKDNSGNQITSNTNSNGEYKFENINKGTYLVMFEFDTNTYTVTTYKKEEIESNLNSDAIITTLTINGEKKLAGITDNIELNKNEENIDIGLIENARFDLSLNKQITKVSVINSQGTEEFTYEDGHTAKVDLVAKYINSANVVVNYKFTITNNGDTVGYVDKLVDKLPSGLEFSSELNKDWYKGNDGQLYTAALSGIAIKPGESSEIELILTKNMTENNTGTFVNNAELETISNLENINEKNTDMENNKSSAVLFIAIKTGSPLLYTGITLACILIIAAGAYIIKKKVLNRGI